MALCRRTCFKTPKYDSKRIKMKTKNEKNKVYLPEGPSMCTNIRFSAMAQTGNRPPPESRD